MIPDSDPSPFPSADPAFLEDCCTVAAAAARDAWGAIRHFYGGQFAVKHKADGPATEADTTSERIILSALRAKYPDAAFGYLSEETENGTERMLRGACWIIDPIDGTRDFIEQRDDFAIQLGLAVRDADGKYRAAVGVVFQPTLGLLFRAVRGGGAWVERHGGPPERLRVSAKADLADASMVITRSNPSKRMEAAVRGMAVRDVYAKGSLGVKVSDVASGVAEFYINTARNMCKEWDVCGPQIILEEAGGTITDLSGEPITYNHADVQLPKGLLASNTLLHAEALRRLAAVPELADMAGSRASG